jgi:hypothetical protein
MRQAGYLFSVMLESLNVATFLAAESVAEKDWPISSQFKVSL